MSAVFISYRRNDSSGHTGRLYDHLCEEFGQDVIFRDIDTIEPGTDFVDAVESNIKDCAALIVVIGTDWLTAKDEMGRRLDDPNDFVRIEVASALKKKIRVIPVLVKGAIMPAASSLPEDLAALSRRHALEISDSRWEYDMSRLITTLSSIIETEDQKITPQSTEEQPSDTARKTTTDELPPTLRTEKKTIQTSHNNSGNNGLLLTVLAAALILGLLIWQFIPKSKPVDNSQTTPEFTEPRTIDEKPDIAITETVIPEQVDRKIDEHVIELLSAAEQDLSALRLTSPAGNNAFEKYNVILEQDPEHEDALNGIRLIAKKYIGMSENALHKGNIQSAEKFLSQAVSVYPQVEGITSLERSIQAEYLALEKQQIQREAEAQRRQDAQNAEAARERAEKEAALIAREREARQKALMQREKTESCLKQCNSDYRRCQEIKAPDSTECESNATTECNKVQDACLGDPQTALIWGDLGAESECQGKFNQCLREKANECRDIIRGKISDCEAAFSACKRECQ